MDISGATKVVGIFGDPVGQSLSPAMHNTAFGLLGLDFVYAPFHVSSDENALRDAVRGIRALGLKGVNITIPHKEKVIKYLDELSPDAKGSGSVNTIVNRGGRLIGYNTDGEGFISGIGKDAGFNPKGKDIIIIGAGGAARSIAYGLIKGKARSVLIANRTRERATEIKAMFSGRFRGTDIQASGLGAKGLLPYARRADLLVNTTSVGMMGTGSLRLPLNDLPCHAIVADIVYRPLKTSLLKDAEKAGLRTHNGLHMLVEQGAATFRLWTGRVAPREAMLKAAIKALKGR
jgi:shikimate dehydrogenase